LNALGDHVGVLSFGIGVLFEFAGHRFAVHPRGHEVVVHVAQHADNLRSQSFVQDGNGFVDVAFVTLGDGAFFNLVFSTLADFI